MFIMPSLVKNISCTAIKKESYMYYLKTSSSTIRLLYYTVTVFLCAMHTIGYSGDFSSAKPLSVIEIENRRVYHSARIGALTTKRDMVYAISAASFGVGVWSLSYQLRIPAAALFANSAVCLIYCNSINDEIATLYKKVQSPCDY